LRNFAIHGKYSKNIYDNPNYYVSLVIFQISKIAIFKECPFTSMIPLTVFLPYGRIIFVLFGLYG
jgi:hypothetical protein